MIWPFSKLFSLLFSLPSLVFSILLYLFGRLHGNESSQRSLSQAKNLYAVMADSKLDAFQARPRRITEAHLQISGHRYAWIREEIYHVPLETGFTILSRKRGCRYRGKTLGALLLIHGFAQNRFTWDLEERSLANYLAEAGYDVFYMDLRGTRESLKIGAQYPKNIQEYIEIDVPQALKIIKLVSSHKKIYLVGHSMGGAISCACAGRYSDQIGGVVHIAGVYGFTENKNFAFQQFLKIDKFVRKNLPWLPKTLLLPTREIAHTLRLLRFMVNSPLSVLMPLKILHAGSVETALMTKYLYKTFEPSSLGVMQGLTDIAHGQPLVDEKGNDYFKQFEDLHIPLLVICADKDDLVNIQDSLMCFESSNSKDKEKLVYVADASSETSSFGHCDLLIGRHAVTHVWEKLRIWLDQRRKLGMEVAPAELADEDSYFLPEGLSGGADADADALLHLGSELLPGGVTSL